MKPGEKPSQLPEPSANSSRKRAEAEMMITFERPRSLAGSHRQNQEEAQVSLQKPPAGPNLL